MNQRTLKNTYTFEGKGLHTGCYARMKVCPAPVDTGIVFRRVDLPGEAPVPARAEFVSRTARSTTISVGKASVSTVEHLLSALTGLGVDNAIVEIDAPEVPILDGSALPYVSAMAPDGVQEQDSERRWITIEKTIDYKNPKTGSWIRIEPADSLSFDSTIDFNSRVLGVQTVHWDSSVDYVSQIAPCRTFCFFHEIVKMALVGLVKGGDVDNAIVIVEKPVHPWLLHRMEKLFHQPLLEVTESGYLSNLSLRFDDECGRHKLLDLMGDLRLAGGFLKAHITAYKPGHSINTTVAKLIK